MLPIEKRIKTKKELKEWIDCEKKRLGCKKLSLLSMFNISEADILLKHIMFLRTAEYYTNTNKMIRALIYKFKLSRLQNKFGIHVPLNTCGKGLKLMHVGNVLINSQAIIGENCSIHMGVKIVAGGRNNGVPIVNDNCVIGVGAVLLGEIEIAKGIAVGANAVVNKSFLEEEIAIAGVPAKKISNNGRSSWAKKAPKV